MANSLFRYHVTNHGFLTWMIFAPLWRRIKNKWDGLQTIITKWKRNKNLKMQSFCPAINCSNRTDRGKNKSNYRFPSTVKNNDKEGLKLSKVRREKWLAQIFREDLTQRKLKKTRIKVMFSASASLIFSQKVHYIRFEKQIHILS